MEENGEATERKAVYHESLHLYASLLAQVLLQVVVGQFLINKRIDYGISRSKCNIIAINSEVLLHRLRPLTSFKYVTILVLLTNLFYFIFPFISFLNLALSISLILPPF